MREVITQEIDLRPKWIRSFAGKNGSRSAFYIASGVVGLVIAMFAFGGRRASNEPPAIAKSSLLAAPQRQVEEPVHAIKDDAPIIIHATREPDAEIVPAKSVAKGGLGSLKLASDPQVAVFDGDRRLGRTPLEVSLTAGTHELRFVDQARHLEVKRKIDIKSGGQHQRDLSFGIGALRVRAPDGTKLWLNKKYAGEAPFKKIELAEGRHHVKLKNGDDVVEEWVVVPPSQTVDYRVNF